MYVCVHACAYMCACVCVCLGSVPVKCHPEANESLARR